MTISEKLLAKLQKLSSASTPQKQTLSFSGQTVNGYQVRLTEAGTETLIKLTLADIDRYSALLTSLEITGPLNLTIAPGLIEHTLRNLAENCIHRLGYLVEPLVLVELDSLNAAAQLRSIPQHPRVDERDYWELLIQLEDKASLSLARYHWSANLPERQLSPYPAIYANLARMAQDLALVLQS